MILALDVRTTLRTTDYREGFDINGLIVEFVPVGRKEIIHPMVDNLEKVKFSFVGTYEC